MKKISLIVLFIIATHISRSQIIPVDSVLFYVDQQVVVYGKVTETSFNYSKKRDTSLIKMKFEANDQAFVILVKPDARSQFGYRPETVLLNKFIYVSGTVEKFKDRYQMQLTGPFDIVFNKNKLPVGIESKPGAQAYPEVAKTSPAKETRAIATQTNQSLTSKPKISKPAKPTNSSASTLKNRTQDSLRLTASLAEKKQIVATSSKPKVEKPAVAIVKKADQNKALPAKDYSLVTKKSNNPNPLSKAPVGQSDTLVGHALGLPIKVSLKNGPGSMFTNVSTLQKGEQVQVVSCSFGWCKIETAGLVAGKKVSGYVKSDKLRPQSSK